MEIKKSKKSIVIFVILLIIIGAVIGIIIYRNGTRRAISDIPDPVQTETLGDTAFRLDGFDVVVNYMYEYDIEALVVHTKDYLGFDIGDQMSRRDFGLAWGGVAEYNEYIDFHWNQYDRYLSWKIDSLQELDNVGGEKYINSHCSNNHIIPANDEVSKNIWFVRTGDHIRLKGYLVNVDATRSDRSNFTWHSSTTRTDIGNGACEVIYVTDIIWL